MEAGRTSWGERRELRRSQSPRRASRKSNVSEREECLDSPSLEGIPFSSRLDRRQSCFPEQSRYIWLPLDVCSSLRALPAGETLWVAFEALSTLEEGNSGQEALDLVAAEALSNGYGETVLLQAAWFGHPDLLKALLMEGVDANALDGHGRTPLHLACFVGDANSAAILLEHNGNTNAWDNEGKATPLHCAASSGCPECVRLIIDSGADPNACLSLNYTPIHYAVQVDSPECVAELLAAGATTDPEQEDAVAVLHVAASLAHFTCLRLLLESGANVSRKCGSSEITALHLAAKNESADCAKILLDFGADPNATSLRLQTPIHFAASSQSPETLELLLTRGANINALDMDLRSPLHCAIVKESRCTDCIRILLSKGSKVNSADAFGYTPLHLAALNEFSTCVGLLIRAGADVMARTNGGVSALTFIVRRTPDQVAVFTEKLDSSITLSDREIGDADCELRLDFRCLLPSVPAMSSIVDGGCLDRRGESALLLGLIEVGMRSLLKHPLCESFLFLKWRRIRKFFLFSLCYHLIFITLYTTYIVGVFSRDSGFHGNNGTANATSKWISEDTGDHFSKAIDYHVIVAGYMLMLMNLASMAKETFQIAHDWRKYFQNWENWLQWLIIVSVLGIHGFHGNYLGIGEIFTFQNHVAALGTVFIWADLMIQIGRYPTFGVYVQMFTTVSVNFSKFLMAYCCIMIGFGLRLGVLLNNFPAYSRPWLSILTSFIMMSGELEYENIFFNREKEVLYKGTSHIMFLAFVLLVTVILTNLLVGLAVSDIQGLQKTARLNRLVREVEHVAHLETILLSRYLHKMVPSTILRPCLRGALLVPSAPYNMSLHVRPNDLRERRIPRHLLESAYNLVVTRSGISRSKLCGRPLDEPKRGPKESLGPTEGSRNCKTRSSSIRRHEFDEPEVLSRQLRLLKRLSSRLSMAMAESESRTSVITDMERRLEGMEKTVQRIIITKGL